MGTTVKSGGLRKIVHSGSSRMWLLVFFFFFFFVVAPTKSEKKLFRLRAVVCYGFCVIYIPVPPVKLADNQQKYMRGCQK